MSGRFFIYQLTGETAMSEETTETVEAKESVQDTADPTPQEEPFDAERAKALIDKLRGRDQRPQAKSKDG
jgi:hypothetical protein